MRYCASCGAAVEEGINFCASCGQPVEQAPPPPVQQAPPPVQQAPPPPPPVQQAPPPMQQPAYPQGSPQQQYAQPMRPPDICSVGEIYKRVFAALKAKPMLLWGISLMFLLVSELIIMFSLLPIIFIPVVAVLGVGMISVYLASYRGQIINTSMLFTGFNDFKRIAGGMMWMSLWGMIWGMVPVYGIVKLYSYRLVPYILLSQPDISPAEALKKSMAMTDGFKMKMFLADLFIGLIVGAISGLLFLITIGLGFITPILSFLFGIVPTLFYLICVLILPLFSGLMHAIIYDEIEKVK